MRKINREAQELYALHKEELDQLDDQPGDVLQQSDAAIKCCQEAMGKLKTLFDSLAFEDEAEEIHFFKCIKPQFVAEWLFYVKRFVLHARWPAGGQAAEYLREHTRRVEQYYQCHHEFYLYHRLGCTHRDAFYFTRGGEPSWLVFSAEDIPMTDFFSTGYDMVKANLLAFERLQCYLNDELAGCLREKLPAIATHPWKPIPWTGGKAALVELAYAIKPYCRNGEATLTEITEALGSLFAVDLRKHSHIWLHVRQRKGRKRPFTERLYHYFLQLVDNQHQD